MESRNNFFTKLTSNQTKKVPDKDINNFGIAPPITYLSDSITDNSENTSIPMANRIGLGYISGIGMGGIYGLITSLATLKSKNFSSFNLKANTILNSVTKNGSYYGNMIGMGALVYSFSYNIVCKLPLIRKLYAASIKPSITKTDKLKTNFLSFSTGSLTGLIMSYFYFPTSTFLISTKSINNNNFINPIIGRRILHSLTIGTFASIVGTFIVTSRFNISDFVNKIKGSKQ